MTIAMRVPVALLLLASGCDDDPLPPPPPIGPTTFTPGGLVGGVTPPATTGTTLATDTGADGGPLGDASATDPQTPRPDTDGADDVDTIAEIECRSTCDCPLLTRCTADGCQPTAQVFWCCSEPTCPTGEPCETPAGAAGICP